MTEKFKLKRGSELTIQLVSQFYIAQVRQAARKKYLDEHLDGQEPKPPQYAIKCGGGVLNGQEMPSWNEIKDHTTETIDKGTQEDKAAWAEYQATTEALREVEATAAWRVYYDRGIVDTPPEDDSWAQRQREDGIDVPDKADRVAYKCHWIDTEKLVDQQEANWLILVIKGQGDLVREAQRSAAAMFQRPVGQPDGQDNS